MKPTPSDTHESQPWPPKAHHDAAFAAERDAAPRRVQARRHQRAGSLIDAFRYAFAGLFYLLRTQRNAQIHCAIGLAALAVGTILGISRVEWAVIVGTCALVLAAEGANTAIEAVVDIASPGYHPLAKIAKDVAAGAVLLCAIAAVIIGLIIFGPRVWDLALAIIHR